MEIKDIIQLMEAAAKNGLTSFELEEGDWKRLAAAITDPAGESRYSQAHIRSAVAVP